MRVRLRQLCFSFFLGVRTVVLIVQTGVRFVCDDSVVVSRSRDALLETSNGERFCEHIHVILGWAWIPPPLASVQRPLLENISLFGQIVLNEFLFF